MEIAVLLGILSAFGVSAAQAEGGWFDEVGLSSTLLWESRYVDSGRDDLDNGGIFSAEFVVEQSGVELGAWYGLADSVDYKELNLFAGYGFSYQGVDVAFAYTHLEFYPDGSDDDEVSLDLGAEVFGGLYLSIAGVYSFEADGSFVELAVSYPMAFMEERLLIEPSVHQGYDFGYRSKAHDGPNHVQLGIDAEYIVCDRVSLIAYIAHSFAQDDVDREDLGDVTWFGLGLSAAF